jgi:hypothetical protein
MTWSSPSILRRLTVFGEDVRVAVGTLGGDVARRRFTTLDEGLGELFDARRIKRCADGAGQHDVVRDDFDVDIGIGQEPPQIGLEVGNVALDLQVEADDFLAVRTKHEDVGLADHFSEQIDAP